MRSIIVHQVNNRTLRTLLSVLVLALFAIIPAAAEAQGVVTLSGNQQLNVGNQLLSSNGRTRLVMQSDGNLVLYQTDTGGALWSTGTSGKPVAHALTQMGGNFVLYDADNSVWYW